MPMELLRADVQRIETKVDKLAEAVMTLARLDERLVSTMEENKRLGERMEHCEAKIMELRTSAATSLVRLGIWERVVWIIFAVAISTFVTWFAK